MKIWATIRHAISLVGQHRKMVGIIYLVNLCIGLVFSIPLFILFNRHVSTLTMRDDLLSGLHYSWWSSFNFSAQGLENSIRPSLSGGYGPLFDNLELLLTGQFHSFGWFVFFIALAYLFIAAFFNGGAISLFTDERKSFTTSRFFSGAGANFHHMAALATTSLLVFALLYKLITPLVFSLVDNIVGESTVQSFVWIINLAGYLVIFVLVFLITLIFDYAKVIVINDKKESSWLCIWLSVKFIFSNFFKTTGLNSVLVLGAVIFVIVGGLFISLVQPTQILLLILLTIIQQLFVLIKIGLRLTFYAAETHFFQQHVAAKAVVRKRKR
ncbi:hypothetical protein EH223_16440 [candidate division KSB1 bacterium]|nr:hypothetical protein [candidate division KSB1 bacterium]RQW01113.1 MAG: hypothetical protein EH223_16440 [candidate division KSB1 bacterium]